MIDTPQDPTTDTFPFKFPEDPADPFYQDFDDPQLAFDTLTGLTQFAWVSNFNSAPEGNHFKDTLRYAIAVTARRVDHLISHNEAMALFAGIPLH